MDIVRVDASRDYDRYETLTLHKEQLEKEADQIRIAYFRAFGEQITKAFELKIDCIALKKEIAFYVAAVNNGKTITQAQIDIYLKELMAAYRKELQRLLQEKEDAKQSTTISGITASKVKTIYRRLAKMLHPDISPLTSTYPNLLALFNRVVLAYQCNDLKELQKLEVLVNKELEERGITDFRMDIPDLTERIEALEADIETILQTEPYVYKKLLEDDDAFDGKRQELDAEITSYEAYYAELIEKRDEVKARMKEGN